MTTRKKMTSEYTPLLSMVFKIKFLRAMLGNMVSSHVEQFTKITSKILHGEADVEDFKNLEALYVAYERIPKYATPIPKA